MVSPSLHRIVAVHRLAAEDPKKLLPAFEKAVADYFQRVSVEDLKWVSKTPVLEMPFPIPDELREDLRRAQRIKTNMRIAIISTVGHYGLQDAGAPLFRAILQAYSLPRAMGTKVEAANRFFSKTRKPSVPDKVGELLVAFVKISSVLRDFLEVARKAVLSGKAHEEGDTKVKAGPFTLINTGGFPAKMMETVASVVEKAVQDLQQKGLGKVCYGDIQVTKTLSKANVLAFYVVATDEMFVRANAPKDQNTLHTVLHELGHRMERMFLRGRDAEIKEVYRTLNTQSFLKKEPAEVLPKPTKGESIVVKGKTLYVVSVEYSRGGFKVHLATTPEETRATHSAPLATYNALKAGETHLPKNSGSFITQYAQKGGPSENFAEMFAFYCMDKGPDSYGRQQWGILRIRSPC